MQTFTSVLNQMLFLFLCMLIGYILHKKHDIPEEADIIISRLENHVFTPALIINSFRANCTVANLTDYAPLLFWCTAVLLLSILIATLLAPRFTPQKRDVGIYRYALALSNFGFMGNSLVQGLLGDVALFRYLMFTLPASVFTSTVAIVWLTGGRQRFSFRMLCNPIFLSMLVGIALGLGNVPLPFFLETGLGAMAQCYSPMAMLLTGFVVARYRMRDLFAEKAIYLLSLMRGIVLPLCFYGLTKVLHLSDEMTLMIMVFTAMPVGLNTIVYPAAYGGNEHPGAAMALISNLIGLATVPLMMSLVL